MFAGKVELVDVTLRDGEQSSGVAFLAQEKLSVCQALVKRAGLLHVEVGNARTTSGEAIAMRTIANWAQADGFIKRIEALGFVDSGKSVDWLVDNGINCINLLVKGSANHCRLQLRKEPEEHLQEAVAQVDYAKSRGMQVNAYLEDWSNGLRANPTYLLQAANELNDAKVGRIMLADTLGCIDPQLTFDLFSKMVNELPGAHFDFHGHNDYGLAVANSLAAVRAGAKGVHVTVNGLGERAGNTPLDEFSAALTDFTKFSSGLDESAFYELSKLVETFSGKRISANKPICGSDVFTQTAGVHADGDRKAGLYQSRLAPARFGRSRDYALGKLSGRSSLEINLKELNISLEPDQINQVLSRVVELGDKKSRVTIADLPFIVQDVLATPTALKLSITSCTCTSQIGKGSVAIINVMLDGKEYTNQAEGNGGYDAFMNALEGVFVSAGKKLPILVDYEVRIPPGGQTDALVEARISWKIAERNFTTVGVDPDQLTAAIKATQKAANLVII